MIIRTNTDDRKALANAIAAELGTTVRYMGVPSCAYQVGDYTVDREGNIVGEDFGALQTFLQERGFQPEPGDDGADAADTMFISVPAESISPAQLKNLIFMLYSRQTILNRMTQSSCLHIPDNLIERLKENTPETLEDFTSLLEDAQAVAGMTGFDFRDGKVSMAFPFSESEPAKWTAYANLLNRIFDAAMKAIRVFPDRVEPDAQNEKYLAHTWLQRLGYSGADSKAERKLLLGHLTGYCAFANGDKMQAHKEKYTAIRRERRTAAQEAAVLEVMNGEVNGNE